MTRPHALVLFAHGARDPAWARPFEAIAVAMRAQAGDCRVVLAFLELMQPSLAEAVGGLHAQGAQRITVVPVFLGAGGHVRKDLPGLIEGLRTAHPGLQIDATSAIGESPAIIRAIADAAWTLVDEAAPGTSADSSAGTGV
jgi:sirohydrochlorin cobaltochelatase